MKGKTEEISEPLTCLVMMVPTAGLEPALERF